MAIKTTTTTVHQPNDGVVKQNSTTYSNGNTIVRQTQIREGK